MDIFNILTPDERILLVALFTECQGAHADAFIECGDSVVRTQNGHTVWRRQQQVALREYSDWRYELLPMPIEADYEAISKAQAIIHAIVQGWPHCEHCNHNAPWGGANNITSGGNGHTIPCAACQLGIDVEALAS